MCEVENSLNGIIHRWNTAEENINEFEDIAVEILWKEVHRKRD